MQVIDKGISQKGHDTAGELFIKGSHNVYNSY